jgi:hypothetical protein
MKNTEDISSQLNFFSFADVGSCEVVFETAQRNG